PTLGVANRLSPWIRWPARRDILLVAGDSRLPVDLGLAVLAHAWPPRPGSELPRVFVRAGADLPDRWADNALRPAGLRALSLVASNQALFRGLRALALHLE